MRVRIDGLGYVYPNESVPALSGLDLDVESGSIHALIGPSGCGKSTLLRLIAGLAEPTEGSIEFIGERHHDNLTAVVFQEPRLLPHWTVGRNIAIGSEFGSRPPTLYRRIRQFHTKQVGLEGFEDRKPETLSLGQQTMAGLGRGLAHDSEVILLDEPFAHLDAIRRLKMRDEFDSHWQLTPRTVILVTHDVEEAVTMSDRVSVMSRQPGSVLTTVEVSAPRPRAGLEPNHPGLLEAVGQVWRALESLPT